MNRLEEQLVDLQRQQTRNKISKLRRTIERLSAQLDEQAVRHSDERLEWAREREALQAAAEAGPHAGVVDAGSDERWAGEVSQLTVELNRAHSAQRRSEAAWTVERNKLQEQLSETQNQISQLEDRLAQFQQNSATFAEERAVYETGTSTLASSLEELTTRLDEQQQVHTAESQAWKAARQELESQLSVTRTQLQETTGRLTQVEAQLESQRSESAALRQQFEDERLRLQDQRASLEEQLAAREEELRQSQAQIAHWESECKEFADRTQELEQHIAVLREAAADSSANHESVEEATSLQAELAKVRETHAKMVKEWEDERRGLMDELNARQLRTDQHQTDLDRLEKESADREMQWEQESSQLKAALRKASQSLEDAAGNGRLQQLESRVDELLGEVNYWRNQAEPDPRETIDRESGASAFGNDTVVDTKALPENGAGQGAADADMSKTLAPVETLEISAAMRRGLEASPDEEATAEPPEESPAETVADRHEQTDPPVDAASVLAQLGKTQQFDELRQEIQRASPTLTDTPPNGELAATEATPDPPTSSATQGEPKKEQDAIEEYMNRLLARVRGDQGSPVAAPKPSAEREPITEVSWNKSPAAEPEEKLNEEGEIVPRRAAPERSDSLAAMRSLANNSARSAIASHAKRNWMEVAKYKICGAVLGITASAVAFVMAENSPFLAFLGVVFGFVVAFFFGAQALTVRAHLLHGTETGDWDDEDPEELKLDEAAADVHGTSPDIADEAPHAAVATDQDSQSHQ